MKRIVKEISSSGVASRLCATHLNRHNDFHSKPPPLEWIVVRIEVTDTGCGIRPKDMVQSKLFCKRATIWHLEN